LGKQLERGESALLAPYRVLDLTNEKGMFSGKVLASLGAEVIKIEPPGGDPERSRPPFYKDINHPEKSLYYLAFNNNKKSITLNINTSYGRDIFRKLVKISDFVIESFYPGHMDELGLGYLELSKINPGIIMTSITPFGQTGPFCNYKSSDLVCCAMSGFMYLTGDIDRAPVGISVPQAYLLGAAEAAAGTMIAFYQRKMTGDGQHVDVSIRDAMVKATINAIPWWEHFGRIMKRGGPCWMLRGARLRVLWPCKDGSVSFALQGGQTGARINSRLVKWMDSEQMASEYLKSIEWESIDMGTVDSELHNAFEKAVGQFFMTHTRKELYEGGQSRHIMLAPVQTVEDLSNSQQLKYRKFWEEMEYGESGTKITYPGAFIKASMTPCMKVTRAPFIGEHNQEIYEGKLEMNRDELAMLKSSNVI
jgi:benzylsuccinate CoA-transferase BbsE subunit